MAKIPSQEENVLLIGLSFRIPEKSTSSNKDIIDLSNIKLGDPIPFSQGILFCTYSTLRSQKNDKSRLKQIVEWAGADFSGAIAFDECHSMGNAMAQGSNAIL